MMDKLGEIKKQTEILNRLAEDIVNEEDPDNMITLRFNLAVTCAYLDRLFKELPVKVDWREDNNK